MSKKASWIISIIILLFIYGCVAFLLIYNKTQINKDGLIDRLFIGIPVIVIFSAGVLYFVQSTLFDISNTDSGD